MKFCLICPGKIKESYYLKAINEYFHLINKFAQLEIIEVPDEQTRREPGISIDKEGTKILQKIKPGDYLVTLEIDGRKLGGRELYNLIKNSAGVSTRIVFVIGGSLGLSEDVKKRSNIAVSFSDMTFPHQLMRVLLLEQISQWRHFH